MLDAGKKGVHWSLYHFWGTFILDTYIFDPATFVFKIEMTYEWSTNCIQL